MNRLSCMQWRLSSIYPNNHNIKLDLQGYRDFTLVLQEFHKPLVERILLLKASSRPLSNYSNWIILTAYCVFRDTEKKRIWPKYENLQIGNKKQKFMMFRGNYFLPLYVIPWNCFLFSPRCKSHLIINLPLFTPFQEIRWIFLSSH